MDRFPDGSFVRLKDRANGKYLEADDDWAGVSLRDSRRRRFGLGGLSPSAICQVWRVQHLQLEAEGPVFLLLQGAAYGRYLAVAPQTDPVPGPGPGVVNGLRAVQRDLDDRTAVAFRWTPVREGRYVRIRNLDHINRDLRATARYSPWRTSGVAVDAHLDNGLSTWTTTDAMMHWAVMPVEAKPEPLPLPEAPTPPLSPDVPTIRAMPYQQNQAQGQRPVCVPLDLLRSLMFWRHPNPSSWTIRTVRANPDGVFNPNHNDDNWEVIVFNNRSVSNLRTQMGKRSLGRNTGDDDDFITLCVRPGVHGRLMPLVTDLPRTTEIMDIVVLTTASPAAAALRYPHFHPLDV